ncbi:MAG: sulfotransferase [Myxococcota bacterium]|nr:sulfotransferase [Myxococcota bacterium]
MVQKDARNVRRPPSHLEFLEKPRDLRFDLPMIHDNLIFLICTPRSGSTLLQRMLGSHSAIHTHPEPHLLTPLYYSGYYETVNKAPYDHINAAQALREFAQELPRGEDDYLDALRAYASTLYERVLHPSGKPLFLDKTPAYGLVAPFVAKLYPRARFIVLTRHPLAITHSVANSFFNGDYAAADAQNPIARHYVPALANFMRDATVPFVHVRYEDLVADPTTQMTRILNHLNLEFEPNVVTYGNQAHITKSFGDPMNVERHKQPVTTSLHAWASDLQARPDALHLAQGLVEDLQDDDLSLWGYPKDALFSAMDSAAPRQTHQRQNPGYRLKRSVLLGLRKNIHQNRLGSALKKVRYYCDVLLRE